MYTCYGISRGIHNTAQLVLPVFRRSTRKIPAFSFPFSVHFPIVISIFRIFKPKIFTPFWAFFIDKFFEICYNNSTL